MSVDYQDEGFEEEEAEPGAGPDTGQGQAKDADAKDAELANRIRGDVERNLSPEAKTGAVGALPWAQILSVVVAAIKALREAGILKEPDLV